jgi:hypothetical protein
MSSFTQAADAAKKQEIVRRIHELEASGAGHITRQEIAKACCSVRARPDAWAP